ncbi:hypothetical protein BpHYR1_034835 [Brachionus plicatilis]|uniref:Uncharacterized protein n=1 Tax=Brachionus plicatilis TaxID=10195 RepID=A0A3M7T9V8_BRAPC|nr:hypothetical protein BpHYR1_034835 [Brachionus plicatilis]
MLLSYRDIQVNRKLQVGLSTEMIAKVPNCHKVEMGSNILVVKLGRLCEIFSSQMTIKKFQFLLFVLKIKISKISIAQIGLIQYLIKWHNESLDFLLSLTNSLLSTESTDSLLCTSLIECLDMNELVQLADESDG